MFASGERFVDKEESVTVLNQSQAVNASTKKFLLATKTRQDDEKTQEIRLINLSTPNTNFESELTAVRRKKVLTPSAIPQVA